MKSEGKKKREEKDVPALLKYDPTPNRDKHDQM